MYSFLAARLSQPRSCAVFWRRWIARRRLNARLFASAWFENRYDTDTFPRDALWVQFRGARRTGRRSEHRRARSGCGRRGGWRGRRIGAWRNHHHRGQTLHPGIQLHTPAHWGRPAARWPRRVLPGCPWVARRGGGTVWLWIFGGLYRPVFTWAPGRHVQSTTARAQRASDGRQRVDISDCLGGYVARGLLAGVDRTRSARDGACGRLVHRHDARRVRRAARDVLAALRRRANDLVHGDARGGRGAHAAGARWGLSRGAVWFRRKGGHHPAAHLAAHGPPGSAEPCLRAHVGRGDQNGGVWPAARDARPTRRRPGLVGWDRAGHRRNLGAAGRVIRAHGARSQAPAGLPLGREYRHHSDWHWRGADLSHLWADAAGGIGLYRRTVPHHQPREFQGAAVSRRRVGAARHAHAQYGGNGRIDQTDAVDRAVLSDWLGCDLGLAATQWVCLGVAGVPDTARRFDHPDA